MDNSQVMAVATARKSPSETGVVLRIHSSSSLMKATKSPATANSRRSVTSSAVRRPM